MQASRPRHLPFTECMLHSSVVFVAHLQAHPWYRTDLPAGVTSMNEECLKLKGFTAGHQTEEEIRTIIREAMKGPNNSNGFFQDAFDEEIEFR